MALVIEDGTGKANADSYASAAELTSYALAFGADAPTDTAQLEALLRRSALQMEPMNWQGSKATATQALAWPRKDVELDGESLPLSAIPARLKQGQMALALEMYHADQHPPESLKGAVIKERVEGAVEVQYAEPTAVQFVARLSDSQAHFGALLVKRGLFAVRA